MGAIKKILARDQLFSDNLKFNNNGLDLKCFCLALNCSDK